MSDNATPKSVANVLCSVLRSFWTEDGRIPEGTQIDLPVTKAMDLIEQGVVSRVKDAK